MEKSFRYKQLDSLLKHEDGYTLNELLTLLDDDISKRTLQRELDKIEHPPYNMKIVSQMYRGRERLYRYVDTSSSMFDVKDEMQQKFNDVIAAFDSLSDIPQYAWMKLLFLQLIDNSSSNVENVISFDNNQYLVGLEYLNPLAKAILHKQPQRIKYRTYKGHEIEINIHPYYLRQYRNRWFLLCLTDDRNLLSNYALDRIQSIREVSIPYKSTDINFDEWFDDVIGVTVPDTPVETIVLKVRKSRYGYIQTKPLHPTQKEIKIVDDEYAYFSIDVKINQELISTLASYGADMEILSPSSLRQTFKMMSEELNKLYTNE